jgi:replication factor A1
MYGQLPPTTAERLKDVLQEGKVFVIRKFFCNASRTSFRPVESPFMVQFTKYTTVEERPGLEVNYPFCTYSLTAFDELPDPSGRPTRFVGWFYL